MKQLSFFAKRAAIFFVGLFASTIGWAQDLSTEIDVEFEDTVVIDEGPFYAQLWFWVVIGVVFLLLLIVLLRGGGGRKKIVKEKAVKPETNKLEKEESLESKVEAQAQEAKTEVDKADADKSEKKAN